MKVKKCVILLMFTLSPVTLWACTYQVKGINKDNVESITNAMKSITPEVSIAKDSGEIKFTSKNAVSEAQVKKALQKSGISDVTIVSSKH